MLRPRLAFIAGQGLRQAFYSGTSDNKNKGLRSITRHRH